MSEMLIAKLSSSSDSKTLLVNVESALESLSSRVVKSSIKLEDLTTLEERLSNALSTFTSKVLESEEEESLAISISDIGEDLWNIVAQFAPFGTGNEKPIFRIPQAEIKSSRQFGRDNNHLEIEFLNGIKAVSFFSDPDSYSALLAPGMCVDLLANLEKSYFRNRPELRLRIVDIIKS